jgi:hypothetical protein
MDKDHLLILNAAGLYKCFWFHCNNGLPLQLKDTAERILAVDCAAAMVEEMLKQGQNLQPASTFYPALNNEVKVGMLCIAIFFSS